MVAIPALFTVGVGYLLFRDVEANGRKTRKVFVVAVEDQITAGSVEGGVITQPVYEYGKVKVDAPLTKICYTTPRGKHYKSGETVQYGVIEYLENDDGFRTYTYDKKSKRSKVFDPANKGFYIIELNTDMKAHGMDNDYGSTGRRNWQLRMGNPIATQEEAHARADAMFESKTQEPAHSEPTTPKPDDDAIAPSKPLPDFGGGMQVIEADEQTVVGGEGVGDVAEEPVAIVETEEVEEEEIIVFNPPTSIRSDFMNGRKNDFSSFGRRY